MRRSQILLKNITSNFLTQFWLLALGFITTPIIFHKLNSTRYGLLILLNTIPSYFSAFDFGLLAALVKYIAEFKAQKKELKNLLGTAFIVYFSLIILWGTIIFFLANLLAVKLFKIPPNLKTTALISLKLIAINFIFNSLGIFLGAIPRALQRFEIFNLKNILSGTIIPLGTIILLISNKGIVEIIYLYIATNILIVLFFYIFAKKLLPKTSFVLSLSFPILKKLLSFGSFKFISNINSKIAFQLNQFLIAAFLPIKFVSFYTIPASLTQKILNILPNITNPIFPLVSELNSLKLKNKLIKLYKSSTKVTSFLTIPLFFFLLFYAHPFLTAWIDIDFANQATIILKILSIAYLITSFSGIPTTICEGIGQPKIPAFFSSLSTVLYLIFAFFLIPRFKLIGAALAIFLNNLLLVPLYIYFVTSKIIKQKGFTLFFNTYIKFLLLGSLTFIISNFFYSGSNNLWKLFYIIVVNEVIYTILSLLTGSLEKRDTKIIKNVFKIS